MRKKFSKTGIFFTIATSTFVLVLSLYYFVYVDLVNTRESASALSNTLSEEKSRKQEFDLIRKNIKSTLDDHNRLVSIFVPQEGVVDFIQLLESFGRESGLRVTTETVGSVDSEELNALNKEILSISLKTEGSWDGTELFLNYLENLPYKISITSLSFVYGDNSDSNNENRVQGAFWKGDIKLEVIKIISQI